jgi:effector-binding domain-containing protein
MAYLTYKGPYTNREEAYNAVFGQIFSNGYQPMDAPRKVYVRWRFRFL